MPKTMTGYLVIADITGYTRFLHESELDHAQDSLQALLQLLIENTRIPLVISRLEGDAVISYAARENFLQGATLLEMVESTYVAFKRALELMVINTTCTCKACRNIPNLDLKFFVHFGEFGLQPLPAYTELVGSEVNLVHRLAKNRVKETLGLSAYALFTRAAVEALGLQEAAAEMVPHAETYDHIGEIEVFVHDMARVWAREKDRTRLTVSPEEAMIVIHHDFPVAPVHLWDYLLKPEFRALFVDSDTAEARNLKAGRVGEGTVYQCAHGRLIHPQTIVDWQPFESHTILDEPALGLTTYVTYRLAPTPAGARLTILGGPVLTGNPVMRALGGWVLRFLWRMMGPKGVANLRRRIEQDLAAGILAAPEGPELDLSAIRQSIAAALQEAPVEGPGS